MKTAAKEDVGGSGEKKWNVNQGDEGQETGNQEEQD